jgi:hypothetical protein
MSLNESFSPLSKTALPVEPGKSTGDNFRLVMFGSVVLS